MLLSLPIPEQSAITAQIFYRSPSKEAPPYPLIAIGIQRDWWPPWNCKRRYGVQVYPARKVWRRRIRSDQRTRAYQACFANHQTSLQLCVSVEFSLMECNDYRPDLLRSIWQLIFSDNSRNWSLKGLSSVLVNSHARLCVQINLAMSSSDNDINCVGCSAQKATPFCANSRT